MAKPKSELNSGQVLERLRKGPFSAPAHAFLAEVRNQTGYSRRTRSADALAVSLWPSRGIWFAGVEVKVSRTDWLNELKQPAKSAEIQRFCDYWWIAAPTGIVKLEELPETWGLYEINGKDVKAARAAPKLKPEALSVEFIASVLRNQGDKLEAARLTGYHSGYDNACEKHDATKVNELEQALDAAQREQKRIQQQLEWKERDLASLHASVASFERQAGIPEHTIGHYTNSHGKNFEAAALYKVAQVLAEASRAPLVDRLAQAMDGLNELVKLQETVQETVKQREKVAQELDHGEEPSV